MEKIYRNVFFVEKCVDNNYKFKSLFFLVSVLPIFLIVKQHYSNGGATNNMYPYIIISIISFCISVLFLDRNVIKYLNYINMFFCFTVYSMIVFLPLLLSVMELLASPAEFLIDFSCMASPYILVYLFFRFLKKYSIYKKYLNCNE